MKKLKIGGAVAAVFLALGSWASSLEVTDVKIAQRYPWNGLVDITYTVQSDDANKDVWVYPVGYDADKQSKVALYESCLSGEGVNGSVKPGVRHMVWDMAKQMGKNYNRAAFSVSFIAYCDSKPYMVVDLSDGATAKDYPISYLAAVPDGGWTDEYKTTKMLFRLILPGEVDSKTTLTKPFYFAVWPMTAQQYALIAGGTGTSEIKRGLSYDEIRGSVLGAQYPSHQQVDANSLIGKLRLRTGVTFDLATECQWRAARMGYRGYCWIGESPNVIGIYDMGTYPEWCVNWKTNGNVVGIDPVGPSSGMNDARSMCGSCLVSKEQKIVVDDEGVNCFSSMTMYVVRDGRSLQRWVYMEPSFCGKEYRDGGNTYTYDARSQPVCRLVALPNCK